MCRRRACRQPSFQCIRFEVASITPGGWERPNRAMHSADQAAYAACLLEVLTRRDHLAPCPANGCSVFIGFLP